MKKMLTILMAAGFALTLTASVNAGVCKDAFKSCWQSLDKKSLSKKQKAAGKAVKRFCKKKKNKAKCKMAVKKFVKLVKSETTQCGAVKDTCNPPPEDDVPDEGDTGGDGGGF